MILAAQQKQLSTLLQRTSISEALTLRANIVDSPHDQSPPHFVGKVSDLIMLYENAAYLKPGDESPLSTQSMSAATGKWRLNTALL